MRARPSALAASAAAVAMLAACGGGSSTSSAESDPASAAPSGEGVKTPPTRPEAAKRGVRLVRVGSFTDPLYVTAPPGDRRRIFVVEQPGRIMVMRNGRKLSRPFLDIRGKVLSGGERGLLSLAFAPDYARSGRFYVYYTERSGTESIWEYNRATADRANASTARLVLRMADPEANHNGGLMIFHNRLMYVGTGDGGGANDQHGARGNAQSLSALLGKILRIDPLPGGGYRIPPSNPFVGRPGARGEIYAYGLRNPWRFAFDRANGNLTIGDVGQDTVEEIDFMRNGRARGANFGWRPWEGRRRNFDEPAPGAVFPVITHSHASGFCSITGGYVVRDRSVPSLFGRYVYGDLCEGRIRAAKLRAGRRTTGRVLSLHQVSQLSSFGEDAAGHVYAVSLSGPVYRIAAPR
jgi:glucose/arabinose dehydrogenase